MQPRAAEQSGGLVATILANIQGSENDKPTVAPDVRPKSGNGSGGVQPSQVPPSLQNAAARLTTVGATPLRKEAIGTSLATGFLQEHDTLTQWVRAQGMTGHSKRVALTDARALEERVADYGVGSSPAPPPRSCCAAFSRWQSTTARVHGRSPRRSKSSPRRAPSLACRSRR